MTNIEARVSEALITVQDFPKPGIDFKDMTPLLADAALRDDITSELASRFEADQIDVVAGIESRGFFFGVMIADRLGVPFVPIRKKGKLPGETVEISYDLEYGQATIEMQKNTIQKNANVLLHDDLLATGGSALAAAELIARCEGRIAGFSFLIGLTALEGAQRLASTGAAVDILVEV